MAEIFIDLDAEMSKSNYYKALVMKQFDGNSRNLRVSLYNRGDFVRVESGQIVRANIRRADGEGGVIFGTVNDDGTVNILLSGWALTVPGEMKFSISVIDAEGRILSSTSLLIEVEEQEFTESEIPVYTAPADLEAGTYYIITAGTPYSFTTTETVPANGTIRFDALMTFASTYDPVGDLIEAELELDTEAEGTHLDGGDVIAFLDSVLLLVGTVRSEKMDKLLTAEAGNLVAFDEDGNASDSGLSTTGVAGLSTAKMDKRPAAAAGNLVSFDAYGNAKDSGVAASAIGTLSAGKMDKRPAATENDLVAFDANGNAKDSGLATSKVAQNDGYYEEMTVGVSDQLVSTRKINEKVPYLFRTSGGGTDIGNRLNDKIVGGTIVWNQLADPETHEAAVTEGHICLTRTVGGLYLHAGEQSATVTDVEQCFDASLMFGDTIAQWLKTMDFEVEDFVDNWFYGLFERKLYPQTSPTLLSVKASAHITVGFNAYNNATGKAKVVGGQRYQITGTYTALTFEGETVTPDASGFFTLSESGELTVTGGDAATTCVHLVHSGTRNGEFEAYTEHVYPLDDVELLGVPVLDEDGSLFYNGDTYAPDGTVTRKAQKVDLSTLTWKSGGSSGQLWQLYSGVLPYVANSQTNRPFSISEKYVQKRTAAPNSLNVGEYVITADGQIYVHKDDGENPPYPSGYIVYTCTGTEQPAEESASPFADPQIVDDWGTEEYVDTREIPVPVGHDTLYGANLRDKLQMLPNAPTDTGDYIVHYDATTRTCTFKPLAEALSEIESRLSALEAAVQSE